MITSNSFLYCFYFESLSLGMVIRGIKNTNVCLTKLTLFVVVKVAIVLAPCCKLCCLLLMRDISEIWVRQPLRYHLLLIAKIAI